MKWTLLKYRQIFLVVALPMFFLATSTRELAGPRLSVSSHTESYIVQASTAATAKASVLDVGGTVTATLNIINAAGANLTREQVDQLRSQTEPLTIYADDTLKISGAVEETNFPTLIGAADLHDMGINGKGVTIAVLDTGLWKKSATQYTAEQEERILAQYDVLEHQYKDKPDYKRDIHDWNGHGTHLTSIMMSSDRTKEGYYQGVAPSANVVAVRAFNPDGSGRYIDVISAIDWIVSNKSEFNIRVMNLSFSARARSFYWEDPVNQAVMAAWQSGIIVVASAGNSGPGPLSVGVPGNVPYVITVGAMTDSFTPSDTSDDRLATFSAAGPTFEGFVKPDIVAPGGHMLGWMPPHAWLAQEHPEFADDSKQYFTMSGTSQAAAVVSGVVALMLQIDPALTPDEAKCRLMASSRPAVLGDGAHAYSVFQQGFGLVDARATVYESASACANRGIDVALDLSGQEHYQGPARVDESGNFYIADGSGNQVTGDGLTWNQGALWNQGSLWHQGALWPEGSLWNQGALWNQGRLWEQGGLWNQGVLWPQVAASQQELQQVVSINSWVAPE